MAFGPRPIPNPKPKPKGFSLRQCPWARELGIRWQPFAHMAAGHLHIARRVCALGFIIFIISEEIEEIA